MARDRELPGWLAAVHPEHAVLHRAELLLGALVVLLVSVADVRGAVGFSSFGVLVYYAVTNASAWTVPGAGMRRRRVVAALGLSGCVLLAGTLPLSSVIAGGGLIAAGLAGRAALQHRRLRLG